MREAVYEMNIVEELLSTLLMLLVVCVMVIAYLSPIIGLSLVWSFLRKRADRRRMQNLCIKCGYDLRGSKERCPECGREFDAPMARTEC